MKMMFGSNLLLLSRSFCFIACFLLNLQSYREVSDMIGIAFSSSNVEYRGEEADLGCFLLVHIITVLFYLFTVQEDEVELNSQVMP